MHQTRSVRRRITVGVLTLNIIAILVGIWGIEQIPARFRGPVWRAFGLDFLLMTAIFMLLRWIVWYQLLPVWQQRASLDGLTGLVRPAPFWEMAEEGAGTRGTWPWVVAYCDLDDFKQYNDRWGHATGDAVLQIWGRILREQARHNDIIGRLGGEEIGWWFPHTTAEEAQIAMTRVLRSCHSTTVNTVIGFSFSAGIAQGQPGESVWDAARRADRALYEAKAAGKGRIFEAKK
ncbi:MAG: GGDEF domain-containing protein [Firmicutes bacterium]|jgi:diguanylate cyclase (GGDEF)-like protein|nr:GGDEF domain-containing protein [Bacillota bacterium]